MFKTKKSLGQNFLKSQKIIDKIVETANLKSDSIVLEAGPGKGVLTEKLLEKAGKVVAVEKDCRLIEFLQNKFENEIKKGKLALVHGDILGFDIKKYARNDKYTIVANIPYYITGKFLRKFLSADYPPTKMILMLQKEVAQRITSHLGTRSPSGKESILSISVKAYGRPKYIATVKAQYFSPQPKVDSAIILIDNISKNFFQNIDENEFFKMVRQGFSSKRKMLTNNLSFLPKEEIVLIFKQFNIPLKIRAEDLSLKNWKRLYVYFRKHFIKME